MSANRTVAETATTHAITVVSVSEQGATLLSGTTLATLSWETLSIAAAQQDDLRAPYSAAYEIGRRILEEQRSREILDLRRRTALATLEPSEEAPGLWVALGSHETRSWGSSCSTLVRIHGRLVLASYETIDQARLVYETWYGREACAAAIESVRA